MYERASVIPQALNHKTLKNGMLLSPSCTDVFSCLAIPRMKASELQQTFTFRPRAIGGYIPGLSTFR